MKFYRCLWIVLSAMVMNYAVDAHSYGIGAVAIVMASVANEMAELITLLIHGNKE